MSELTVEQVEQISNAIVELDELADRDDWKRPELHSLVFLVIELVPLLNLDWHRQGEELERLQSCRRLYNDTLSIAEEALQKIEEEGCPACQRIAERATAKVEEGMVELIDTCYPVPKKEKGPQP